MRRATMRSRNSSVFIALIAVLSQAALPSAVAQRTEPCLQVRILDPSSAFIQGATVTIGTREQTTDSSGTATICGLGPGPHRARVEAENFETFEGTLDQSEGMVSFALELRLVSTELWWSGAVPSRAR